VRRVWIFLIRATKYPTATGSPQYRSRATLPSDIQPSDANPDRTLCYPSSYLRVQVQGEQHRKPNCLGSRLLLLGCRCVLDLVEPAARAGDRRLESGTITGRLEISPEPLDDRARPSRFAAVVGLHSFLCIDSHTLVISHEDYLRLPAGQANEGNLASNDDISIPTRQTVQRRRSRRRRKMRGRSQKS
jgi:hypothetical protein